MSDTHKNDVEALQRALAQVFKHYKQFHRDAARTYFPTVTAGSVHLLLVLEQRPGLSGQALSDVVGLDKTVVSRYLHELEEADFVARTDDPEDRRRYVWRLTQAALQQLQTVRQLHGNAWAERLRDWPEAKIEELHLLLNDLNVALESD